MQEPSACTIRGLVMMLQGPVPLVKQVSVDKLTWGLSLTWGSAVHHPENGSSDEQSSTDNSDYETDVNNQGMQSRPFKRARMSQEDLSLSVS